MSSKINRFFADVILCERFRVRCILSLSLSDTFEAREYTNAEEKERERERERTRTV